MHICRCADKIEVRRVGILRCTCKFRTGNPCAWHAKAYLDTLLSYVGTLWALHEKGSIYPSESCPNLFSVIRRIANPLFNEHKGLLDLFWLILKLTLIRGRSTFLTNQKWMFRCSRYLKGISALARRFSLRPILSKILSQTPPSGPDGVQPWKRYELPSAIFIWHQRGRFWLPSDGFRLSSPNTNMNASGIGKWLLSGQAVIVWSQQMRAVWYSGLSCRWLLFLISQSAR